jgi:hypothetical protein
MKPGNWRMTASKNCPECSGKFHPRVDENIKAWDSRKFCGHTCRAAVQKRQLDIIRPTAVKEMPENHWKRKVSKECANCHEVIRPRAQEGRSNWQARKFCDARCRTQFYSELKQKNAAPRMYLPVGTPMDPEQAVTPGQRLRWLRVSYSTCGRKTPWTTEMLAEKTEALQDRENLSVYMIEDLEKGSARKLREERSETACMALGVPVKLLSVSQKKFVDVVCSAGLMAKTINNQRI